MRKMRLVNISNIGMTGLNTTRQVKLINLYKEKPTDYKIYERIRITDIGIYGFVGLFELSNKLDMKSIRANPTISGLYDKYLESVGIQVFLVNDLYSFKKDYKQNIHKYNSVYLNAKKQWH